MAQSIQPQQQTLFIPFTGYSTTVDKTQLCAMRCVFTICFLGGCGVALSSISQYRLPTWGYVIDGLFTGLSGLALLGTGFTKKIPPENQTLISLTPSTCTVPPVTEIPEDKMQLVTKLYEGETTCSLAQAQEIVTDLKQLNQLELLNVIPPSCSRTLGVQFYTHEDQRTPLQHWASEGHLEICQLLVEHGAWDYCGGNNNTSALYEAAFYGHLPVVEYLIKKGALANLSFLNNPLFCFIPKFAFEIVWCKTHLECKESCFSCFRHILASHSKEHSGNLEFQFKIPVDEQENNILCWLKKMEQIRTNHQGPMIHELQKILVQYGATNKNVFTKAELKQQGLDIGSGSTLNEIASQK